MTALEEGLANFIFEMGQLRLEPRRGWQRLNLRPETVAEHSLRAAQLGYLLAVQEACPCPEQVAAMLIFHDMAEVRTADSDRIAKRYCRNDEAAAVGDQTRPLGEAGRRVQALWHEMHQRRSQAARIAKDADLLEMAFTARQLMAQGHSAARHWFDSAGQGLSTDTARRLYTALERVSPHQWWQATSSQDPEN